ncbi:MAG: isochorismatase family protein [Armatimonadia bacterium]|nr:isochorismatase family protein [Armatimonadia bacterium]
MSDSHAYSSQFLGWLQDYIGKLPSASMAEIVGQAGGPDRVWVVAVDIIKGFCVEGPLASERVGAIAEPAAALIQRAWDAGVRRIMMPRDAHDPESVEFGAWPPHCVAGTEESELVDELTELPMAEHFQVLDKNSLSAIQDTDLSRIIQNDGLPEAVICIGDCTDLCLYNLALGFRLISNARNEPLRVVVPADCVETYHMDVGTAEELGALPHDGDLLHDLFLYHMALNGCQVVSEVTT